MTQATPPAPETTPDQTEEQQQQQDQTPSREEQAKSRRKSLAEKAGEWNGKTGQPHRRTDRDREGEATEETTDQGGSQDTEVTGDQQPANERKDAPDPPDKTEQSKAGDKAESATDPERLAKAKHALKRNQFSDDDLANMPDERILDRGEKLIKREQDREQLANERARFKQFLKDEGYDPDTLKRVTGTEQGKDDQGGEANTERDKIKQTLHQTISEKFKPGEDSLLSEQESNSLQDTLKAVSDQLVDQYEFRLEQLRGTQDEAGDTDDTDTPDQTAQRETEARSEPSDRWTRQQENIAMDNAIIASDLTAEFSTLKDSDTRSKVRERARQLLKGDEHGDLYYDESGDPRWDEAVRDAATLVIGKNAASPQQAKADMLDRQQKHQASRPSFDNETGGQQKSVSRKEAMRQLWEARQKGRPEAEIQRLANSLKPTRR